MKSKLLFTSKDPEFAVLADKYQFILARRKSKEGYWTNKTYHATIQQLALKLVDQEFLDPKYGTDLIKRADRVYELFKNVRFEAPDAYTTGF